MPKQFNVYEIKTQFSKCLEMVEQGETVVICKRNVPVAEIRPIARKKKKTPELGWAAGRVHVTPSFDEPLSKGEMEFWEEGHEGDPLRGIAVRSKKTVKKK